MGDFTRIRQRLSNLFSETTALAVTILHRKQLLAHAGTLRFIAGAPLDISPGYIVRTLRQKTSQYMLTQFPPLTNEKPSGDSWAPGFFISGGKQAIQPYLIDGYINEIREQQGVYNSFSYQ